MNEPKTLLLLPDQSALRYARFGQKGPRSKWYRTHDLPDVWRCSDLPQGKNHIANLWSSGGRLVVLPADFDRLPEGYHDFDSLEIAIRHRFVPEDAIVRRSASRKVKVFFLVELGPTEKMSVEIAIETLARVFDFDPNLFDAIDLSPSALQATFLNRSILEGLSSQLKHLKPIPTSLPIGRCEELESYNTSTTNTAAAYQRYTGDLAHLFPSQKWERGKEQFVRFCLATPSLLSPNGFGISTVKAGDDFGFSQQLMSRIRNEFVQSGFLKKHGRFYVMSKRAKRFRAAGELEAALRVLYPHWGKFHLPQYIEPGNWHRTVFILVRALYRTHSELKVIEIVSAIRGATAKTDRMRHVRNWYRFFKTGGTR